MTHPVSNNNPESNSVILMEEGLVWDFMYGVVAVDLCFLFFKKVASFYMKA